MTKLTDKEKAKKRVISYLKKHEYSSAEEIASALGIDVETVFRILHELEKKGSVRPEFL